MDNPRYNLVKHLFLQDNLDEFKFKEGKVAISVTLTRSGDYYVIYDFNGHNFNFDEFETKVSAMHFTDYCNSSIRKIFNDPEKFVEEYMELNPHFSEFVVRTKVEQVLGGVSNE